jgi:hypothetical protein
MKVYSINENRKSQITTKIGFEDTKNGYLSTKDIGQDAGVVMQVHSQHFALKTIKNLIFNCCTENIRGSVNFELCGEKFKMEQVKLRLLRLFFKAILCLQNVF